MSKFIAIIISVVVYITFGCNHARHESKTGTVKAGGFQVYFEREGSGDAIILLHAGFQDHTMWKEQVKELSKHFETITLDLPFHGSTTGADTMLLARDIIKILMDSLDISRANIAGLSMGASVAQDFIIAYPQYVHKAILISAGVNGLEKKLPVDSASMNWYFLFSEALGRQDTARAAVEFTRAWAEGIYRAGDSLQKPVSQYVYNTTLANLKKHKMQRWPKLDTESLAVDHLSSIRVPVLIIEGDKDLPYVHTSSTYLEKNLPGARRVLITDVAHMLNMEKPEELNRLIIDFLQGR